jgi:hypothetical protein
VPGAYLVLGCSPSMVGGKLKRSKPEEVEQQLRAYFQGDVTLLDRGFPLILCTPIAMLDQALLHTTNFVERITTYRMPTGPKVRGWSVGISSLMSMRD